MANGDPCPNVPAGPTMIIGPLVGIIFLLGSFAIFWLVLTGKTDVAWKEVALTIVGALLIQDALIVGKYYGASQSSDRKTEIMADAAKTLAIKAVSPIPTDDPPKE
jgi:hypothetical protein